MRFPIFPGLVLALVAAMSPPLYGEAGDTSRSAVLVQSLEPLALREIATEVLERHPGVARARQHAAAAAARAPQVRSLPDPVAAVQLFILPPETRVGPQELMLSIQQKFPWFGKLALREQAALYAAAAAEAEIEAVRLDAVTEARRLFYELAFLDEREAILDAERLALERFEEASRARYAAGTGLLQETVRIQASLTRVDQRRLEIAERRAALTASLNALRDRPATTPVDGVALPPASPLPELDLDALRRVAAGRPEIAAAEAAIGAQKALVELAEKNFKPDFMAGLSYTRVGRRDDEAGRRVPPEGNGDDVLALSGSVELPVRRGRLVAGLEEALANLHAAEEEKRRVEAEIERAVGDAAARLPLEQQHYELLEGVLKIQAREALSSAEAAYTTGKLNAVDLLDAEVVLFDVRTAAARIAADIAVTRATLERAMAHPLEEAHHE